MKEINEILKERRMELNMTMLDVAKRVGVSEGTISRWESGDIANMKRDKIASLAETLQISPGVIMGWEEPQPIISLSSQEYQLIIKYRNNPQMQPAVNTLLGIDNSANNLCEFPVAARSGDSAVVKTPHSKEERNKALDSELPGVSEPVEPTDF